MISAVCGRAPPACEPPKTSAEPPKPPETSHEVLSVINTLGLSSAKIGSARTDKTARDNVIFMTFLLGNSHILETYQDLRSLVLFAAQIAIVTWPCRPFSFAQLPPAPSQPGPRLQPW